MTTSNQYSTFKEFWPFYLKEHSSPANRALHFIGTLGGIIWFVLAIYLPNLYLLPLAIINGYAFAWFGHFFIEKNKPASFKYPFKSFLADWVMFFYIITFQIGRELRKLEK